MDLQILDIVNLPLYYVFAFLTGYALATLFAKDSSFWENLGSFEKVVIGGALGLGLFYGITFPVVLLTSPWTKLNYDQILQWAGNLLITLFLFPSLFAHLSLKISRQKIFKIYAYVIFLLPYASLVEWAIANVITLEVSWYPSYLSYGLSVFWSNFAVLSALSLVLIFFFNLIIFQLFVIPLQTGKYASMVFLSRLQGKEGIRGWKHRLFLLKPSIDIRRISVILVLAAIIVIPITIIPLDQSLAFSTPRLQMSEEKPFTGSWHRQELILTRIETFKGGTYQFYELQYRSYNVTLPSFPYHVNSICLTNPSNFSKEIGSGRSYGYLSSWIEIDNLWISSNGNASFTFKPDPKQVKEMIIDFSNATNKMIGFNITYYQQFLVRNISVQEDPPKLEEYQNGTRLESYYFYFHNNENVTLKIPYFEWERLIFEDVDLTSVRVYIKNQYDPLVTVDRHAIYPWMIVPPYGIGNLTITLISRIG